MTRFIATIICLRFISPVLSQEIRNDAPCNDWYVMPVFYNNVISDSTEVKYWENYWYYRSGDSSKLFPDTLKIELSMFPSSDIAFYPEKFKNCFYDFKVEMQLKYGYHDDSYYVVNPKLTEPLTLYHKEIFLKEIYEEVEENVKTKNSVGISICPVGIPMKEILNKLNISLEDGPWDFENRGRPYALNQIIINTYFIDKEGNTKCRLEFTFPVNGSYDNPDGGKWEY